MSEYTAITKNAIIENTEIGFNLFLRSDVNGHSRYILFCRAGEQFTHKRREELLSRNSQKLYISSEDNNKYLQYQERNLKHVIEDSSRSAFEKSEILYQVAENVVQDLLNNPKLERNIERASEWVSNTVNHIIHNENTFSSLLEVISHDYDTYTHSINVSVIGLLFGRYLSLNTRELESLGTGLLFHDIGKIKLPPEIINKRGILTNEEIKIMNRHPKAGLGILEHRKNIDSMSLKVVIQHHENYDGSGYPYGIGGNDIHLFGHIARIVDVYDAMTSHRSYAAAKSPFAVLAEMKNKMSHCFNKKLFIEFVCFLGLKDKRKKVRVDDALYSTPTPTPTVRRQDTDKQLVMCAAGKM
ncbi:MAG: HD domain-containing protein [Candidatus Brocadiales bacterium]|nr:HD domain-containing protein [Candidatus Brocadiales bacterium]